MSESFYLPIDQTRADDRSGDGRFRATAQSTGPWDPSAQHGGPPSALLVRAMELRAPRDDMIVGRFTVEILGAIPVGEVEVRSRVARPGRSVELVEAVMTSSGREVARASAWRVRRAPELPGPLPDGPPSPPALPTTALEEVLQPGWVDGYVSAIEWRLVEGGFSSPGPCSAWTRLRVPLLPDEEPSGLQRVLAVADSGNGLSSALPITWFFINPELTVHLHREPEGEWVHVDAVTTASTGGAGLATTRLSDLNGPLGVGAQSLLVTPRSS